MIAAHHSFPYLYALFILLRCDKRNSGTSFIIPAPSTVTSKFDFQIIILNNFLYLIFLVSIKLVVEPKALKCIQKIRRLFFLCSYDIFRPFRVADLKELAKKNRLITQHHRHYQHGNFFSFF